MSDFAGEIDAEPGEPFLSSGVHLDMPDYADGGSVSRVPDSWVSMNRGPGRSPRGPGV